MSTPSWELRFRASDVTFPTWARLRPDRLVYASSETGAYQVYAQDLTTGARRQVTDVAIGTQAGQVHPDGQSVVWFDDPRGDEVGRWVRQPFSGGATTALLEGVPEAWSSGLALGRTVIALGTNDAEGYVIWVSRDGAPTVELLRSTRVTEVGPLSRDERLLAVPHAEHGELVHLAVRVHDLATGQPVAELWDGPGKGVAAVEWSPAEGDSRLLLTSELTGQRRPTVWSVDSGERREYALEQLDGDVTAAGWCPSADAVLLVHSLHGRDELLRLDLESGEATPLEAPEGSVLGAAVRPDGAVWARHTSGAAAPRVLDVATGAEVVAPQGPRAPAGHDYQPWSFPAADGQTVHGFLALPAGAGPHPTVLLVHGGPHWHWSDAWRPEVPAWVDHGWAVAMVNYRGSTGHGATWRDALIGDPGFPEVADEVAGLDDLVARGVADPARVVISGGSWGGYITLLALGRHPDRFRAGIAVVPVADYVAAYEDEAPVLQAFDRDLFGGDPSTHREMYVERSPLTYVDQVRAPVLLIAGDNDSRCPIRQVRNYVERLVALGVDHHLDVFDAGHGSLVAEERVRHMRLELEFLRARGLLAGSAS